MCSVEGGLNCTCFSSLVSVDGDVLRVFVLSCIGFLFSLSALLELKVDDLNARLIAFIRVSAVMGVVDREIYQSKRVDE